MPKSYLNKDKQVLGTGQRAGWSPPCWEANNDVILMSKDKCAPGALLIHPDGRRTYRNSLAAFVDDTNMGITTNGLNNFHPKAGDPIQKERTMHK